MAKVINLTTESCIECPYCKYEPGHTVFEKDSYNCSKAQKLINGGIVITKETPIPKWCPLPDGSEMMYFVVREELEETSDDYAIEVKSVDEVKLGNETYIIHGWEKNEDFELVSKVGQVARETRSYGYKDAEPQKIAVILGRTITKDEVDLDLGNTQRKG